MDPTSRAPSVPAHLAALLVERLQEARAAFPDVHLADADFVAHVAQKVTSGPDPGAFDPSEAEIVIRRLHTADLFLARASASGDRAAIAHVERTTFGEVDAAYRRFPKVPLTLDDVKQRLWEKLLVTDPPGILAYAGTGALRGWIRAAVLHMLLNIAQRETREEPSDGELFDVIIGSEPSAELTYVKLACREELEAALAFAMSKLTHREQSLLRYAHVDGRNVDEIGAIYAVHRATAARWVAAARQQLVEHTRADLIRRLGISDVEARSIIAAALSGVGSMLIAKLGSGER